MIDNALLEDLKNNGAASFNGLIDFVWENSPNSVDWSDARKETIQIINRLMKAGKLEIVDWELNTFYFGVCKPPTPTLPIATSDGNGWDHIDTSHD